MANKTTEWVKSVHWITFFKFMFQAFIFLEYAHWQQVCQIFLGTTYQSGKNMTTKYTKWPQNLSNDHKIYQMTTKSIKWPQNLSNDHKIYQMTTKSIKWPQNIPNGRKIYQCLSLKDAPKFSQIGIFSLKIYHLATLSSNPFEQQHCDIWRPWTLHADGDPNPWLLILRWRRRPLCHLKGLIGKSFDWFQSSK
jgi:hypothetical protein